MKAIKREKIISLIRDIRKSNLPYETQELANLALKHFLLFQERDTAKVTEIDEGWHLEVCPYCRYAFELEPIEGRFTEFCPQCGQKLIRK